MKIGDSVIKPPDARELEEMEDKENEQPANKPRLLIGGNRNKYAPVIDTIKKVFGDNGGIDGCDIKGYGLLCYPCPYHRDDKYDRLIIDAPESELAVSCTKEPTVDRLAELKKNKESFIEFTEAIKLFNEIIGKPTQKDADSLLDEIIARNFLINHIVISIHVDTEEGYKTYVYNPDQGIYEYWSTERLLTELKAITSFMAIVDPSYTLLDGIKKTVHKLTAISGDESIFSPLKEDVFYLPGRVRDIEVNLTTGEVRILKKDPINRPFIKRMPYDFDIDWDNEKVREELAKEPPEFKIFKKYTTPKFWANIQIMLAKAFIFHGLDYIFWNFSRTHNVGKTTIFSLIKKLAGDVVEIVKEKNFKNEYFESRLVNRTILLMEEYKGDNESVNEDLKQFASNETTIMGNKKYATRVEAQNMLSIVINSNTMALKDTFLKDKAFMRRLKVTPFIHIWETNELPSWYRSSNSKEGKQTRERLVLYIVTQLVPKVLRFQLY